MTKIDKYIKDPLNTCGIPLWKQNKTSISKNTLIVHDSKYDELLHREFTDQIYYRMSHDLVKLSLNKVNNHFFMRNYKSSDLQTLFNVLYDCYGSSFSISSIDSLVKEDVFSEYLCVFMFHDKVYSNDVDVNTLKKHRPIGVAIGFFDKDTKEASIEYLGIIEKYRRRGLATLLLQELLIRMSDIADIATVSIPESSEYDLVSLFKKVGFSNEVKWHFLTKE